MKLRSVLAGGALLLWLIAAAMPIAAREMRLYEVRHRVAQELVPLVQTALGPDGRVVADARSNTLLLTGEPAAVDEAIALLGQLDARLRTVVLRYASEDSASLARRGIQVDWQVDAGGVRIGNVRRPPAKQDGVAVGIRAEDSATRREGSHASMLRILEGETGRIASGASVPLTSRRIVRRPRGAVVEESTQLVSAESGFEARPRVLGDGRIELALRPFHDRLGPDGRIETASAETRVVLTPGETVLIGGLSGSEQTRSVEIPSGVRTREDTGERLLSITATLE